MQSRARIKEVINSKPDFKERIIEESKKLGKRFAYCVDDDEFVSCDISYFDYLHKHYICVEHDIDGKVYCNRAFNSHLPLLMVVRDMIEL